MGVVLNWRKSKKSKAYGDCVEVANAPGSWRKSRKSFSNGACVEAGDGGGMVGVRDTTQQGRGPVLMVPAAEWRRFTASLV